jgi:hypothetical protein
MWRTQFRARTKKLGAWSSGYLGLFIIYCALGCALHWSHCPVGRDWGSPTTGFLCRRNKFVEQVRQQGNYVNWALSTYPAAVLLCVVYVVLHVGDLVCLVLPIAHYPLSAPPPPPATATPLLTTSISSSALQLPCSCYYVCTQRFALCTTYCY